MNAATIAYTMAENARLERHNKRLLQALAEIRVKAHFEQETPTGMHMTCLSLIEKTAIRAMFDFDEQQDKSNGL